MKKEVNNPFWNVEYDWLIEWIYSVLINYKEITKIEHILK